MEKNEPKNGKVFENKHLQTSLLNCRPSLKNLTICVEILVELTPKNFALKLSDEPKKWTKTAKSENKNCEK